MGEFHCVTIRIADDAQIPGKWVQELGTEFQQTFLPGCVGQSVDRLAGFEAKTQMAYGGQRLLRLGAWHLRWVALLQHHYEAQLIVIGPVAEPNHLHSGAGAVRMSINDSQARVSRIERDARFQAMHVQS